MSRKAEASCPSCGEPTDAKFRPFCSRGCKDRDLLQWLGEGYRIPGPPALDGELNEGVASEDEGG